MLRLGPEAYSIPPHAPLLSSFFGGGGKVKAGKVKIRMEQKKFLNNVKKTCLPAMHALIPS